MDEKPRKDAPQGTASEIITVDDLVRESATRFIEYRETIRERMRDSGDDSESTMIRMKVELEPVPFYLRNYGRLALIQRQSLGHLTAYVAVEKRHPLFQVQLDDIDVLFDCNIVVHGGITYAGTLDLLPSQWCVGFDAAHAGDLMPNLMQRQQAGPRYHQTQRREIRDDCEIHLPDHVAAVRDHERAGEMLKDFQSGSVYRDLDFMLTQAQSLSNELEKTMKMKRRPEPEWDASRHTVSEPGIIERKYWSPMTCPIKVKDDGTD